MFALPYVPTVMTNGAVPSTTLPLGIGDAWVVVLSLLGACCAALWLLTGLPDLTDRPGAAHLRSRGAEKPVSRAAGVRARGRPLRPAPAPVPPRGWRGGHAPKR